MNKVFLIGRLTAKPELRYTNSNKAYCRFSLAVQRNYKNQDGEYESDFINCEIWDKQAENLCNYQDKGSKIALEGRIQFTRYEVNGEMKNYTSVVCNNIEFLDSKKTEAPKEKPKEEPKDPFADFGDTVSLSDNFLD